MKCPKCGAELTNDTKFCSYCGEKIEAETSQPEENYNEPDYVESTQPFEESKKDSAMDKIKCKAISFWKKLSLLGKLATASLALFALLGLIAFLAGRVFAGIIAVVAVALVVVALLMKKQVIKVPKTWIPLLAIILSFVLIIPYFSLFKVNIAEFAKYNWDDVVLADMLPKPASPYGEIISNSDDYLSLDVAKTSEAQYKDYIEKCKEKGFTIDTEIIGSSFYAYNDKGYKLSLSYYDYSGEMHINLDSAMEMETITWPDSAMAKLLPVPKSTTGKIYSNDEDSFSVYIGNTSVEDYKAYIKACEDKGFTIDTNKQDKSFTAKNADSYKLTVNYEGNNVIYISITEPEFDVTIEVECVENWIFSKYDVEVSIDDNFEGTISHGDKESFDVVLKRGNHIISFESAEDDTLDGEVELKITKNESIKLKISCSSFGIDVEILAGTLADNSSEGDSSGTTETKKIAVTMSEDDFKGMNYKDAEKKFREMGFTKFEYKTVDTETESSADTICYIEIVEFLIGDSDFAKGDKFDSDSTITFYSYKYKEPEAPRSVFYSTNDYETAKKGNTGVFSYVDNSGSYDIYWIIDFDDGYVYYFTDGNGESFCDRLKIESGDLNTNIKITYHDGGTQWSYKFHFKYVNHPETLIMVDQNGFDLKYTTTDLDDALALRSTKTIKDY